MVSSSSENRQIRVVGQGRTEMRFISQLKLPEELEDALIDTELFLRALPTLVKDLKVSPNDLGKITGTILFDQTESKLLMVITGGAAALGMTLVYSEKLDKKLREALKHWPKKRLEEFLKLFKSGATKAERNAKLFAVIKHNDLKPRPTETNSHHGVMSAWMKNHFSEGPFPNCGYAAGA